MSEGSDSGKNVQNTSSGNLESSRNVRDYTREKRNPCYSTLAKVTKLAQSVILYSACTGILRKVKKLRKAVIIEVFLTRARRTRRNVRK